MTRPFDDPAKAREAGRRGGKASGRRRLSLDKVEAELGSLDSLEDAQRWLRMIALWTAAGMLTGAAGNVCVRSVEVWLKGAEAKLSREITTELRRRLEDIESQAKQQRVGAVR